MSSFNPDHLGFDLLADILVNPFHRDEIHFPFKECFKEIDKSDEIFKRRMPFGKIYEHVLVALPGLFTAGI